MTICSRTIRRLRMKMRASLRKFRRWRIAPLRPGFPINPSAIRLRRENAKERIWMSKPTINICLIGQKFMGRTHSNAYLKVAKFFDVPIVPVMHTICGRDQAELNEFKERWGWQNASTDWKKAVANPEIGLVDVGTPNHLHKDMSI